MAQIVRVFTRNVGGTTSDETFPPATIVEVAMDVEARPAEIGSGIAFSVGAVAIDLSTLATAVPTPMGNTPPYGATAHMGTPAWPAAHNQFVYQIAAGFGAANDICMVLVFLKVGAAAPFDAYFVSTFWMRTA